MLPSWAETLQYWAGERPEHLAVGLMSERAAELVASWSYADLDRRARAIAAALPVDDQEPVLLLYPPVPDFLAAFAACLYRRAVAVPALPPRPNRPATALAAMVADAGIRVAATTSTLAPLIRAACAGDPRLAHLHLIETDQLPDSPWAGPRPRTDDIAFIQYTSGSTGQPKGVVVPNRALMANQAMIRQGFAHDDDTRVFSWLPPYHDMGLIGNLLHPITLGVSTVLMSPFAFIKRPYLWLAGISRFAITTTGGPNFAFDLCVDRVSEEQKQGLDLSSLRLLYNGAEPLRAATFHRFAAAFAPCGFNPAAFYPCYGLAEATLFATGSRAGHGPEKLVVDTASLDRGIVVPAEAGSPGSKELLSSGYPFDGQRLIIVDPDQAIPLPDGTVGEIWTAGAHVAAGYHGRPDDSAGIFAAHTANGDGPFLRTGDLGFLWNGALYVVGRRKTMLIVNGRNLFPHDLEAAARAAATGTIREAAAFSIDGDKREDVVMLVEIEPTHRRVLNDPDAARDLAGEIRQAVTTACEAPVDHVRLCPPGTIEKTTSGKIRHHRCRQAFLALPPEVRAAAWSVGSRPDAED